MPIHVCTCVSAHTQHAQHTYTHVHTLKTHTLTHTHTRKHHAHAQPQGNVYGVVYCMSSVQASFADVSPKMREACEVCVRVCVRVRLVVLGDYVTGCHACVCGVHSVQARRPGMVVEACGMWGAHWRKHA